MLKTCAVALLLSIPAVRVAAQQVPTPEMQSVTRAAMTSVHFLAGDWAGSGWMMGADGKRHAFNQTERIRSMLGGEVLLIEGRGVDVEDTTRVVHEAVAFIGYDAAARRYVMRSFVPGGRTMEAEAEAQRGRFVWRIGPTARYTITVDDAGAWHEIGEFTRDQGLSWQQFLEMRLIRRR